MAENTQPKMSALSACGVGLGHSLFHCRAGAGLGTGLQRSGSPNTGTRTAGGPCVFVLSPSSFSEYNSWIHKVLVVRGAQSPSVPSVTQGEDTCLSAPPSASGCPWVREGPRLSLTSGLLGLPLSRGNRAAQKTGSSPAPASCIWVPVCAQPPTDRCDGPRRRPLPGSCVCHLLPAERGHCAQQVTAKERKGTLCHGPQALGRCELHCVTGIISRCPRPPTGAGLAHCLFIQVGAWGSRLSGDQIRFCLWISAQGRVTVRLARWPPPFCAPIKTASGGHLQMHQTPGRKAV